MPSGRPRAQLTPELVGGLVAMHERGAMLVPVRAWAAMALTIAACLVAAGCLYISRSPCRGRAREAVRARTILELAEAVDEDGEEAIRRIANAAETDAEVVRAWHTAWRTACRGPSAA